MYYANQLTVNKTIIGTRETNSFRERQRARERGCSEWWGGGGGVNKPQTKEGLTTSLLHKYIMEHI